jgi:hypothetical protein
MAEVVVIGGEEQQRFSSEHAIGEISPFHSLTAL